MNSEIISEMISEIISEIALPSFRRRGKVGKSFCQKQGVGVSNLSFFGLLAEEGVGNLVGRRGGYV